MIFKLKRESESWKSWKYASTYYNGIAFGLRTKSGQGNSGVDDKGATHFLAPDCSNRALGEALIDCLSKSRNFEGESYRAFFNDAEIKRNELSWRDAQVANMGVKNYLQIKKAAAGVGVDVFDDIIELKPSENRYGRNWFYFPLEERPHKNIWIPYTSDPSDIGAALREAFKRCEGKGRDELVFPDPMPD